jgi:hypothetical protein
MPSSSLTDDQIASRGAEGFCRLSLDVILITSTLQVLTEYHEHMAAFHIALGVVFEIDSSPYPMRVIAYDDAEVMYDVWWPHKNAWAMASLLGNFTYYRLARDYVEANGRGIRIDPLSDKEQQIHRPDLPFAVAQRESISWYDGPWAQAVISTRPVLAVNAIYLSPFGPRDSAKPPVLIQADNGEHFTELELLTKASELQHPLVGDVRLTEGVGIYRAGIKKRTPSYYIWGARSRADAPPVALSHAAKHD